MALSEHESRAYEQAAWRDAIGVGALLLLLVLWEVSGLDLPLARLYGNAEGFSWRNHWLTGGLLHGGARAVALSLLAYVVLSVWLSVPLLRSVSQRGRIWMLGTILLCVTLIPLLKQVSSTSCPWSLVEFGGEARYVPHWLLGYSDGGPGGCFPAGHASSAFGFLAGWFALRERAPLAAKWWLILTVTAGLLLGWVQMMRGAHYLSHSLWTAWICLAVTTASFHSTRRWRVGGRSSQPAPA
ncbi:MAG: phosphatase PAP2 family protein [Hydrogenophaga sp.]|uniref:phosphatase PAP2 family protein n=1 Tax=Hydrogenophaga sp. TaxID=1904254 RepID=UPI001D5DAE6C|nr:phosphatase PAP2 family protein [Hydrogenophaga sp.]MBW0182398.1 phosphatase PAP2 family protein [Hydrogenophaga sp.]